MVTLHLDGRQFHLEPGQTAIAHGPDRDLRVDKVSPFRKHH
jgi:hypothetical protein